MNVALSPDLEKMVNDKVASGEYVSAREVVGEALRLLQERDENQRRRREALRRQIAVGLEQLERGEFHDCENDAALKSLFDKVKASAVARSRK
jgi:antitoxin ParD1/3/4